MSGTVYYLIDTNYLNSGSESPITRAELNSEIETKEKTNGMKDGMELIKNKSSFICNEGAYK